MKKLNQHQRAEIYVLAKQGMGLRPIARQFHCSVKTAKKWAQRPPSNGLADAARPGRPRCTTLAVDRKIVKIATSGDRRTSLRDIAQRVRTTHGTRPSYFTVRDRLAAVGLKKRAPKLKPLLTERHKQKRLVFAQTHVGVDWSNAAFHDEKKFYLRRSTKNVWRLRGEVVIVPQAKHSTSVNVWGACGRGGLSPLLVFDENLTGAMLHDILQQDFLPNLAGITGVSDGPWVSFHDGDPKYKSKIVQSLLTDADVPDAGQPPSSPDLNIIENVWHLLTDKVQQRAPTNKASFVRTIKDEWKKISTDLLENLVLSMPRRLAAAVAAGGGSTRY